VGLVLTDPDKPTVTHEGGVAFELDAKGALFTLASTSFVQEDTLYETAATRDNRLVNLVHQVAAEDPEWVARFVPYLRGQLNMRSAAVVVACEYAHTVLEGRKGDWFNRVNVPAIRGVIASACLRADEPAEVIGYWWQRFGRGLPKPVKRGVADAAVRLYTQRSALRYDGKSRAIRMADVIELTHPKPRDGEQAALFRWLLDHRHRDVVDVPAALLPVIEARAALDLMPVDARRPLVGSALAAETLNQAGMSWEALSGWLQGPMDATAWSAVIPSMGLMALTRNLRNFDEAKVPDAIAQSVMTRLGDAEEVRRSRQFPFRFWTAYREAPSKRWAYPLEQAVRHACSNIPQLGGRTLVFDDVSGSMDAVLSARSSVQRWEVGAVFAGAMTRACEQVDLIPFATHSAAARLSPADDILKVVEVVREVHTSGRLEHGTNIWGAVRDHWDGHDRIVIFTDMQAHDSYGRPHAYVRSFNDRPVGTLPAYDACRFIYAFDLAGYDRGGLDTTQPGRYQLAGFSDAAFRIMEAIERGARSDWPF
jgi:hypothetical protein